MFIAFFIVFFNSCSSYFTKSAKEQIPTQLISQNTRIVLLSGPENTPNKQNKQSTKNNDTQRLKIVARMTYLNPLDSSIFHNREYFFLEIFNDDEEVLLPDSMQISMFGRKPLWIRKIDKNEYDSMIKLENNLSDGYLVAFYPAGPFEQKRIKVILEIASFEPATFDFSFAILKTHL